MGKTRLKTVEEWFKLIDESRQHEEPWLKESQQIIERYRKAATEGIKKLSSYSVLYSNTETMRPLMFSRLPEARARRRNSGEKAARDVGLIIERGIDYTNDENKTFHQFNSVITDYLLAGRGQVRIRLHNTEDQVPIKTPVDPIEIEPERRDENGELLESAVYEYPEGTILDEETGEYVLVEMEDQIVYQEVVLDYLSYDEWTHSIAKRWEDVTWVAFEALITEEEAATLFGKKKSVLMSYGAKVRSKGGDKITNDSKLAEVWEIWDKDTMTRCFVNRGYNEVLMVDDDPLGLDGFFPCPRPLYSITTNETTTPVPFFKEYESQANELDDITARITALTKNLKYRRIYDSSFTVAPQFNNAGDSESIPVDDFVRLTEGRGLEAVYAVEDIVPIANVITVLEGQRKEVLAIIHDIIGISDIMRGKTDPRETASAQRIKGDYGTLRISSQQRAVQRFIRDAYELMADAMLENIEPRVLSLMTGVEITKDMLPLMRAQKPREFVVDIETDSTILADDMRVQQEARELIEAIAEFAQITPLLLQQTGETFTKELFTTAFKAFPVGRTLEDTLEDSIAELQDNQASQQEEPTPEQIKAENERLKLEMDQQKTMLELQFKAQELEVNSQLKIAELAQEQQKLDLEAGDKMNAARGNVVSNALDAARLKLEQEKLDLEKINPNKNIVAEK